VAVPESSPPEPAGANDPDRSVETQISSSQATLKTADDGEDSTGNREAVTAAGIDAGETDGQGAEPETPFESSPEDSPLEIENTGPSAPIELESDDGDSRAGSVTAATIQRQTPSKVEPAPADPPAPVTSTQIDRSSTPIPVEPAVQVGDLVGPGPGVVAPRRTSQVEAVYPMVARRLKKRASVSVRMLIDETGQVLTVELMGEEAGYGFDVAALKAARKTTWKPATKGGVPVKMWWTLRIEFRP
jgi:TonB family protein